MLRALSAMLCAGTLGAASVTAQETLPDFATCMDVEAERFEWRLAIHRSRALDAEDFDLWNVRGVEYCGNIAITLCDRAEAPLPCLEGLAADQDSLRLAIMAHLPLPQTQEPQDLPNRLYNQAWLLAGGTSAGPDCDGAGREIATWCAAREANGRLKNAVLAWQVARYLKLSEPAIIAGWARPAPPVPPVPRPER